MRLSGGPVVQTLHFQVQGVHIQSLVGELRSHMLHSIAKKKEKKKEEEKKTTAKQTNKQKKTG